MLELFAAAMLLQVEDACHAVMARFLPARCPAWRALGNDAGTETFVDPASARPDGAGFEIVTRLVHAVPQAGGVRSRVTNRYFDCAARTVAVRRTRLYDTRGILLSQREAAGADAAAEPVAPRSVFADLLGQYCPVAAPAAGSDPCTALVPPMTDRSCPRWRPVWRGNEFELFVNPDSLVRRGDNFEISLRYVYNVDRPQRVRSRISRHRYICARRAHVPLDIASYDVFGRRVAESGPRPDGRAEASVPRGSPGARLLSEYCRR